MFLQSVTDDSLAQTGDRRLFLAGYLNHARKWALFKDAWAEALKDPPAISYLKMVEAQNLRGEFRGWSREKRDAKLTSMARVIRHFDPISYQVSVSTLEFSELVRPYAPYGLKTPYFPCIFLAVSTVAQMASKGGLQYRTDDSIDFIFDEQNGVSTDIDQTFNYMARNLPRRARKIINGRPIFRSDATYLPLQAADMLAWHVRREHEDGLPLFGQASAERIRGSTHLTNEIGADTLARWGKEFRQIQGVSLLQTKTEWQKYRKEHRRLLDAGVALPHGAAWKNFVHDFRERIVHFFKLK